jgi:NAD(P)H dehydrogenase (quinone)
LWAKQALAGKMFGVFVSTASPGGGQELTAFQSLSVAVHQGMVFVPPGYQLEGLTSLDEVHGGSPWGTVPSSPSALLPSLIYLFFSLYSLN